MEEKGFLASLFDTSFASLVTPRVIKVIYIITMVVIGLAAVAWIIAAFADSVALGLVVLVIVAPLLALLYLIYTRVLLEVILALFRIMESNQELVQLQRTSVGGVAASTPPPPAASPPPPPEPPASEPPPSE
jgi:hypothetical protein